MKKTITYINTEAAVIFFGGKAALAKAAGVSRSHIYNWLKVKYIPAGRTKKMLAETEKRKRILDKAYNNIIK